MDPQKWRKKQIEQRQVEISARLDQKEDYEYSKWKEPLKILNGVMILEDRRNSINDAIRCATYCNSLACRNKSFI